MPEFKKGQEVQVKGEVVSVKPKYDPHSENAQGVMVVPSGSLFSYWFKWDAERGIIKKGDNIKIEGKCSGVGDERKGVTTVFLRGVKVEGKECGHRVLILDGKEYVCDGCGDTARLEIKKGGSK